MAIRCAICGDPDPDIDVGLCMDCISAGIKHREEYFDTGGIFEFEKEGGNRPEKHNSGSSGTSGDSKNP